MELSHLTPTPRRKTQIHHRHARFEQAILVIDLEQLKRRTALETLDFGRPGELVFPLPISPSPR